MSEYDDIIHLPHHVSRIHPQMSMEDRAAQFSPFAALTGYDAAIVETARLTAQRVELDEYERQALNEKLQFISEHLNEHPKVSITCFVPDARKEGGEYVTVTGNIKKLDDYEHRIVLMDGSRILMEDDDDDRYGFIENMMQKPLPPEILRWQFLF